MTRCTRCGRDYVAGTYGDHKMTPEHQATLSPRAAQRSRRYAEDPTFREKARAASQAHYRANRETVRESYRTRYQQRRAQGAFTWTQVQRLGKYGLTVAEWEAMLEAQGGVCAICGEPETAKNRTVLAVDHDHATGRARGLLCHRCNRLLGHAGDDPEILRRAADYLTAHVIRQ